MPPIRRPTAILTDIEGTTTPIAFVRDELFPYARARLADYLRDHAAEPEIAAAVAEATQLASGQPVLEALRGWLDRDEKISPLKLLQGKIWQDGYANGTLLGRIYPDVPPVLRAWHASGIRLYVYSSGSETAQRLIFGHSDAGNLAPLFSGFFDTRAGPKRAAASYRTIADAIALPPAEILFLSDIEQELDAATESGMDSCQLARPQDATIPARASSGQIGSPADKDARHNKELQHVAFVSQHGKCSSRHKVAADFAALHTMIR